jgi:N-acetylmuramoyl-L-alanine amidase
MSSWLLCLFLSSFSQAAMMIAVDPGHGGVDHGATSGKIFESHIAMGVSRQLVELLNRDPEFKAFLTRQEDKSMELPTRVAISRKAKSDLFVSVHANSSPDPASQGMEIYFRNELEPDQESLLLASLENQMAEPSQAKRSSGDLPTILQDMRRSIATLKSYELSWHVVGNWKVPFSRTRQLPIKQGPFHVIKEQNVPAVLIEIGFVTNEKEAKRLASTAYQKEIARTIYKGLRDYKETLDKGQTKALK